MDPADRHRRRQRTLAILGAALLLVGIGLGTYGLFRGPGTPPATDPQSAPPGPSATANPSTATGGGEPQPLPVTADPEAFARSVATALFTWSTTGGHGPSDYAQPLLDVADDDEANALAADIRSYLPTTEAWAQLTTYQTRQWLTVQTTVVPDAWATAVAQAAHGQLPPGAVAYTITGTRHRAGTWGTQPVETSRPAAFTVFLTCPPPAPEFTAGPCRLLRLSQLDHPLH
nr:hypothetical protein [Propionicimonas sp.]